MGGDCEPIPIIQPQRGFFQEEQQGGLRIENRQGEGLTRHTLSQRRQDHCYWGINPYNPKVLLNNLI